MIQPINSINFNNYSQKTTFKAKVPFTGHYDPHCVSRVGDAKVLTLGEELKHEFKPLIDSVKKIFKTEDTNNIVSQNGETLFHTMPDGSMIPVSLKESAEKITENSAVKASVNAFKEKFMPELTDTTAAAISETQQNGSVLTHLLYDGSGAINMPVSETVNHTTILDAANILTPKSDTGILNDLLEQSDSISDLTNASDALSALSSSSDIASEAAGTLLGKLAEHADDIQDVIDTLS